MSIPFAHSLSLSLSIFFLFISPPTFLCIYLVIYLPIDLIFPYPPNSAFLAPQEDEDQVVQDAADAAGALM